MTSPLELTRCLLDTVGDCLDEATENPTPTNHCTPRARDLLRAYRPTPRAVLFCSWELRYGAHPMTALDRTLKAMKGL